MKWLFGIFFLLTGPVFAESCACTRIDMAPAALRIDVLESGETVHQVNLFGIRLEGSHCFSDGWSIKSCLTMAPRMINHSSLFSFMLASGHYIPWGKFLFNPNVGATYTNFHTSITRPNLPITTDDRFLSISPFIGLDITYLITDCWRIYLNGQYSWSRTHTTIKHVISSKGFSQGANYGLAIERDISDSWSINAGVGYNSSMSHEKHGIRAFGGKIGMTYWY